jgi:hypothetical protein
MEANLPIAYDTLVSCDGIPVRSRADALPQRLGYTPEPLLQLQVEVINEVVHCNYMIVKRLFCAK